MAHHSRLVVSCEHGGNLVPPPYQTLFENHQEVLNSHRGYDLGALALAQAFAASIAVELHLATTTRLLVDLNRSIGHRALFSEFTRGLRRPQKAMILRDHYLPHREAVLQAVIQAGRDGGQVVHIAVHTFTPVLNDKVRTADIGLLYDPARAQEQALCLHWERRLREQCPDLRIRRNYPYLGKADGLPRWLRKRFADAAYLGIELEVNQKHAENQAHWLDIGQALGAALRAAVSI